ncbi:cysteine hydrolase family protein [Novosphingobium sp. BL-52-GroH]|uniref:cysteine hydrolase family protein n=1 Tax=Novosphingobium sp. BL-52-GroH TaxID=3349877 RepID=UPI00384D0D74
MAADRPPKAPDEDQEGDRAALLIIDMINGFDFEGADILQPKALKAATAVRRLKDAFEQKGWPIVYVNDNFGEWHSERSLLIDRALEHDNPVTALLRPAAEDFFIIKPQFSGFYATNLPVLLPKLGVRHLVITGIATDICVLFTAADAHMRDYTLWIPEDAVAAQSDEKGCWALDTMAQSMAAETAASTHLSPDQWFAQLNNRE